MYGSRGVQELTSDYLFRRTRNSVISRDSWAPIYIIVLINFYELIQSNNNNYILIAHLYYSIPPFVFFFNPTIQLKKIMRYDGYYVGYQIKSNYGYEVNIDFKSYFKQNNEFCAINNNRL